MDWSPRPNAQYFASSTLRGRSMVLLEIIFYPKSFFYRLFHPSFAK